MSDTDMILNQIAHNLDVIGKEMKTQNTMLNEIANAIVEELKGIRNEIGNLELN